MSISRRLRFTILNRDNFTCQYCGSRAPEVILEIDHVHPRSLGGLDDPSNLKTACFNCNRGKATQFISVPLVEKRYELSADNLRVMLALEGAHAACAIAEINTDAITGSPGGEEDFEYAELVDEDYYEYLRQMEAV